VSDAAITRVDGLTDAEGFVSDHLVEVVNSFARLPREHPQELTEFVDAVHRIQGLLVMRIARRHYPKGWPTYAE
jgi:hypothetical protein